VALEQVFLLVPPFSSVSVTSPTLHTRLRLNIILMREGSERSLETSQKSVDLTASEIMRQTITVTLFVLKAINDFLKRKMREYNKAILADTYYS